MSDLESEVRDMDSTQELPSVCVHELIYHIGDQDDQKGNVFPLGNCFDCHTSLRITDSYEFCDQYHMYGGKRREVYELKEE